MIPKETKEKIFALYWKQKILMIKDDGEVQFTFPVTINASFMDLIHKHIENYYLLLNPLSAITNEDAAEVHKLLAITESEAGFNTSIQDIKEAIISGGIHGILLFDFYGRIIDVIDFLRSRGYALPAYSFSVSELVEYGVFKLKEK